MTKQPAVVITLGALVTFALFSLLAGCSAVMTATGSASASPPTHTPSARETSATVRYPTELIGLWVAEHTECPGPDGEYAGDRILEIEPLRLIGYEEVRTPVNITRLSRGMSWRINALVDVGPSGIFEPDLPATYVLEHGALTIEHDGRTERYRPCLDP